MAQNIPPAHYILPSEEDTEQVPRQQVSLTVVPQLPGIPERVADDTAGYLGWGAVVSYNWDFGLRPQLPATSATATDAITEFVRVHSGGCILTFSAIGVRLGEKPQLPSFKPASENEVLLARRIVLFNPATVGGALMFGVAIDAIFGLQKAPKDEDSLPYPGSLLLTEPAGKYLLDPGDYSKFLRNAPPMQGLQSITY